MSNTVKFTVTSNEPSSQLSEKLISSNPKEAINLLRNYLRGLESGAYSASISSLVNNGNAGQAVGTLTVSTGVATDTAVISGTTLTCVDHREATNITFAADVAGSLNNTWFKFEDQSGASKYYVWFDDGGGVNPAVPGRTGIHVVYTDGDSAATLATAAVAAATSLSGVTVSAGASGHIIVKNTVPGVATATADGTAATGFTFSRTITGSAVSSIQYQVYATDGLTAADLLRAINANTTINLLVSASISNAIVTVSSLLYGVSGNAITLAATGGVAANVSRLAGGTNDTTAIVNNYSY